MSTEGENTRCVAEGGVLVTRSRRAHRRLDQLRGDEDPAVGDGVVRVEHLQRADGIHLADRERHVVRRLPLGGRRQQPGRLSREVQPGRLPEAQRLDLVQQPLLADTLRDLRRADVGRLGQDLRRGERLGGVGLGVVEGGSVQLDLVGHGEASWG